jgi:hypothetical protein
LCVMIIIQRKEGEEEIEDVEKDGLRKREEL